MTTIEKIQARILHHLQIAPDFNQALCDAWAEADDEALTLGWPVRTRWSLARVFADVAADMVATTIDAR